MERSGIGVLVRSINPDRRLYGMSQNQIIYIITQTPGLKRLWKRLSMDGKRRAIYIANGDDFMLSTILEDVLADEKGN